VKQLNRVTVELWLWLGKELKGSFRSLSETRSVGEELVEEGTSVEDFLYRLASRYEAIAKHVFDIRERELRPDIVANFNERVINPDEFYRQVLRDGDTITIFKLYTGG
jgi:hypothetical protein